MKKVFSTVLLFSIFGGQAFAWMDCDRKLGILEQKINIAKGYGNYNQVYGLQRAYDEVAAKCGVGYYGGGRNVRDFSTSNAIDAGNYYYGLAKETMNDKRDLDYIGYSDLDYIKESIDDIEYEIKKLQSKKEKLLKMKDDLEKNNPKK